MNEKGTQTLESYREYDNEGVHPEVNNSEENADNKIQTASGQEMQSGVSGTLPEHTEIIQPGRATETVNRRNPRRIPSTLYPLCKVTFTLSHV